MLQINKPQPNKRISKPNVCFWLLYFLYLETYFEAEGAHCKMMYKIEINRKYMDYGLL
jgi:hypothetical protein